MILVNIKGGLGNQIIQIGFAASIAQLSEICCIDNTRGLKNTHRNNHFKYLFNSKLKHSIIIYKILSKFFKKIIIINDANVKEASSNPVLLNSAKIIVVDGYFQDISIKHKFDWLKPKKVNIKDVYNIPIEYAVVSVHIRAGDYLSKQNSKIYHSLDEKYYIDAINIIKNKIEKVKFIVFSDSLNYARLLLANVNCIFYQNSGDDLKDFFYMCSCDHFIIANSTFSWAAAALNSNDHSYKIGPKNWYINKEQPNLFNSKWILV